MITRLKQYILSIVYVQAELIKICTFARMKLFQIVITASGRGLAVLKRKRKRKPLRPVVSSADSWDLKRVRVFSAARLHISRMKRTAKS